MYTEVLSVTIFKKIKKYIAPIQVTLKQNTKNIKHPEYVAVGVH